jgi:hypothetical protein
MKKSRTKKQEQPTDRVIMITVLVNEDKTERIKLDHTGFSISEIVGLLEQVKFSFLSKRFIKP